MQKLYRLLGRTLAAAALVTFSAAAGATVEEDFLAARDAFRVGDARKLDLLARRLKGYVLEPYVAYFQLRLRIDQASPEEIRRFAATYQDTPLAQRLLADWLKLLGKNQAWDLFDAELPRYAGDDVEIACYGMQSRLRSGHADAVYEARPLWFVAKEAPESCTPLFSMLVADGRITLEDVWTRVRVALEAGQVGMAGRAAAYLPAGQAPDYRTLTLITSSPLAFLEKQQFDIASRGGRESVMFAAYRLARTAPQQAAAHWGRLESRFSPEDRAYVWGQIAQSGAMRHDPDALAWFAKARDLSDVQLAWKTRAALRARKWSEVGATIDAMTSKERNEPAWRYWKARSLRQLGREQEALALLKPLSAEYNFYGQLALEDLGEKIATPPAAYKPTQQDLRAAADRPALRRALELYRLNLRVDGMREWIFGIRNLDDRQLLAAAELARQNEIPDRSINTADRTETIHDFNLRYPAPYRELMRAHTRAVGLDEAWVYGLIRQESRFIVDAKSSAGAMGLMQLMPATAQWVAKKLGWRTTRRTDVTEVDTNLSLGTYYLRHVYDVLDGSPVLASAAYNAGPGRARAWRPEEPMEGAIYAETIPFSETRDYVKKVMSNASYYAHTFTQQLQSLKQRMGVISPRERTREASLGDTP